MIVWAKFLVRAAAAFMLGGVGVATLLSSTWADRGLLLGVIGGVMIAAGWLSWPKRPNAWRRDPPTDRQVSYAVDLGIQIPPGISKGELSDLISQAKAR